MTRKLRVIGLAFLAVCSIGAVSVGSAQAAAHWTVAGASFTGTSSLSQTVQLTGTTKLTAPGLGLTIECTALQVQGGQISGGNKGSINSLSFRGSRIPMAARCQVHSSGDPVETINTELLDLELGTVGGTTYLYLLPAGTNITEIVIEKKAGGPPCASTGFYKVPGTNATKVPTGTNATYLPIESSEAIQKAAGSKLFVGTQASYLDIVGNLSLVSDQTWGVGL